MNGFSVTIDHAQPRVVNSNITSVVTGIYETDQAAVKPALGWDERLGSTQDGEISTFLSKVTGTLMLRPGPLFQEWDASATGIYARLAKSAFTFNDSSKWVERDDAGTGFSKFLALKDSAAVSADRTAVTTATYAKNRGFYIALFNYAWNDSKAIALKCGWNSSASDASGVSIVVYANGEVEVKKDGNLVNRASLKGQNVQAQEANNKIVSLTMIPCRQRELLIVTNQGGEFTTVFDDIEEDDPDPTITGATNFWFEVPEGAAAVEVAPLKYPTSGWRPSIISSKLRAPGAGQVPYTFLLGAGTASVVQASDGATAFTPDGTTKQWRFRVDLTSDGDSTPFVHGGFIDFESEIADTDAGAEQDITASVVELSLDIPENPSGQTWTIRAKNPESIDPGGLNQFLNIANRPVLIEFGGQTVLDGQMTAPQYDVSTTDATTFATFQARDMWVRLENYRFTDVLPLDGFLLEEAIAFLLRAAGVPDSYHDIEATGVTLEGPEGSGSRADWQVKVEVGDTAAEWIERLHEAHAATWFYGFAPTPDGMKFRFVSPETIGETSALTVYESIEDAEADGLYPDDPEKRWTQVVRSAKFESLDPEANRITVTGIDIRNRRPIVVVYEDQNSIDPTLAAPDRPDNWLGETREYGFQSPLLTTQALCEAAAEKLADRLTKRRYMAEIECEMLVHPDTLLPIWRGDVVTIYGKGDWRVISMSVQMEKEPDPEIVDDELNSHFRPARYVLEQINDGAKGLGGLSFGNTIAEIRSAGWNAFGVRTSRRGKVGEEIERPASYAGNI